MASAQNEFPPVAISHPRFFALAAGAVLIWLPPPLVIFPAFVGSAFSNIRVTVARSTSFVMTPSA